MHIHSPILAAALSHLSAGRLLKKIRPKPDRAPSKVVFEFDDGTHEELPVASDQETFTRHWHDVTSHLHSRFFDWEP